VVRLEPEDIAGRPGLAALACHQRMAAQLARLCPCMPPMLAGGAESSGALVAAGGAGGGWARARLLGGGRLLLPDSGREEPVANSRRLRELPAGWAAVPAQALQLQRAIEAGRQARPAVERALGRLEGGLLSLRVVGAGGGLRGHLLHRDSGQPVYRGLPGLRLLWQ
jgi:hypothetical protein